MAGSLPIVQRSALAVLVLGAGLWFVARAELKEPKPGPKAVEQARRTVRMLDDLHKGYVVTITDMYVKAKESRPAARVAKKVFQHMQKNGWGKARLIDATGEPFSQANVAKTDFEKKVVEQMKAGKDYYEEVGRNGNQPVFRAGTRVPVVMKACITCHTDKKMGDLLGAIVYEIPIRE